MANAHPIIRLESRSNSPPPESIATSAGGDTDGSSPRSSQTHGSGTLTRPLWTHRVSASFNAMADQISAASQAIAMIPPLPDAMFANLAARLDSIESTQERLEGEFRALQAQLGQVGEGPEKFEKALAEQAAAFKLE